MFRRFVLCGFFVLLFGGIVFARHIQWKPADKPPVLLKEASALADAAVEKQEGAYHCIGAKLAKTFSDGDWELHYASATGKHLWVSVGSDKSVRVSADGFEY